VPIIYGVFYDYLGYIARFYLKNESIMAMVAYHYNSSYSRVEISIIMAVCQSRKIVQETISQKYSRQNRAGRVAQEVQSLFSKYEFQSSNSAQQKQFKKR
jgi:hypothetical protein